MAQQSLAHVQERERTINNIREVPDVPGRTTGSLKVSQSNQWRTRPGDYGGQGGRQGGRVDEANADGQGPFNTLDRSLGWKGEINKQEEVMIRNNNMC